MTGSENLLWYCVRTRGIAKRSGWLTNIPFLEVPRRVSAKNDDVVEVNTLGYSPPIAADDYLVKFRNRQRGIVGVELQYANKRVRFSPSYMIASNLNFERALQKFLTKTGVSQKEFSKSGTAFALKGRQYLMTADCKLRSELTRVRRVYRQDLSKTGVVSKNLFLE